MKKVRRDSGVTIQTQPSARLRVPLRLAARTFLPSFDRPTTYQY
ncbi:MAG TPA: hypothetical protein VMF06_05090 [Candidatus Limnocylindria bacterium]|nr:hypothetical protein [Candidatus Limnocylindria bacterium]